MRTACIILSLIEQVSYLTAIARRPDVMVSAVCTITGRDHIHRRETNIEDADDYLSFPEPPRFGNRVTII